MKSYSILLIFFINSFFGAEEHIVNNIDSKDSIKVWNDKSWDYMYKDTDSALYFARKASKLSNRLEDNEGLIQAIKLQGIAFDVVSEYDSALYYYNNALEYAINLKDTSQVASLYSNIGLTGLHKGDLKFALENFLNARKLFEVISPYSNGLAGTYNNIGIIYLRLKNYSQALSYFNHALPIYDKHDNKIGVGAILTNIADVYHAQGRLHDARNTLMESIEIKEETNDLYGLSIAYNRMASMLIEKDSLDEAGKWLEKTLHCASRIDNKNTVVSAYHMMQKIFSQKGQYNKAIRYNHLALDISLEMDAVRLEAASYKKFSELYEETADYFNAYYYLQKYLNLHDSLSSKEQLGKLYEMQLDYEMQKKSDEIALLTEKQKVQQLEIDKQRLLLNQRTQLIIIIASSLGLLLLLLYIRYLKYKHRQKMKMEMAILNQKEQQTKKILQAEVKERKRIGEELHDGLGQYLSLIKLKITDYLDKVTPDENKLNSGLLSLKTIIDQALNELRNISHNLSPIFLQEKGLSSALVDLTNRIRNNCKCNIELEITGLNNKKLSNEIEHTLYRIVQELLNNVIRHAQAENVFMQIVCNESELTLMVEDDGKGFDKEKANKGMGLININTRLANMGGTFEVDTMPERGTIISVSMPLKL